MSDMRVIHSSEIADDPAAFEGDYVPLEDVQAAIAKAEDDWIRIATQNAKDANARIAAVSSSSVADPRIPALRHAITMACGVGGVTPEQQQASWREVARIALDLAGESPTWQPIDTHDGSSNMPVLVADRGDVVEAYYSAEHDVWWEINSYDDGSPGSDRRVQPTHWMPLPAPPAASPQPIVLPTKAEVEAEGFEAVPVDDEPSASSASAEADKDPQ